ncbi:MAG: ankyrin repeat domain-containing protein, partial [Pseudomonadota bacterium]|nr:ankyrin repeat domain-containing protein [Pseudomonadota bacterium]
ISAIHRRDTAMIRVLLKNGASPDRTDNSGRSARDYARLMTGGGPVLQEIAQADADRAEKGSGKTYGPSL